VTGKATRNAKLAQARVAAGSVGAGLGAQGGEAFSRALTVLSAYAEGRAMAAAGGVAHVHASHHGEDDAGHGACLSGFLMTALRPQLASATTAVGQ
jgi:hypothetical protein